MSLSMFWEINQWQVIDVDDDDGEIYSFQIICILSKVQEQKVYGNEKSKQA